MAHQDRRLDSSARTMTGSERLARVGFRIAFAGGLVEMAALVVPEWRPSGVVPSMAQLLLQPATGPSGPTCVDACGGHRLDGLIFLWGLYAAILALLAASQAFRRDLPDTASGIASLGLLLGLGPLVPAGVGAYLFDHRSWLRRRGRPGGPELERACGLVALARAGGRATRHNRQCDSGGRSGAAAPSGQGGLGCAPLMQRRAVGHSDPSVGTRFRNSTANVRHRSPRYTNHELMTSLNTNLFAAVRYCSPHLASELASHHSRGWYSTLPCIGLRSPHRYVLQFRRAFLTLDNIIE